MLFISQLKKRLGKYAPIGLIHTAHTCLALHLLQLKDANVDAETAVTSSSLGVFVCVNMQMGIFITNCRHLHRRRAVKKVCQEPKRRQSIAKQITEKKEENITENVVRNVVGPPKAKWQAAI